MTKLLGYTLATIGFVGFIFFLNYEGQTVLPKELWFVLSIFTGIIGAYFVVKQKLQSQRQQLHNTSRLFQIGKLKLNGEKIKITLENSEIKTRCYQQEVTNDKVPTSIQMLDSLYDSNRNYKTEIITHTYILFLKKYGDTTFKFVSQPTFQIAETFRNNIDKQNGIDLYVDRQNPNNYYFDLPFV